MIASAIMRRQSDSRQTNVAVVGAGGFGARVISRISQLAGIEVAVTTDVPVSSPKEG